ncbi:hypothetical protein [Aeromonas jandaei]|uniref:hypothetical protein n=1 Tax=Aeromonas jandaei TaxID=650 RepID=UPI003F662099
MERGFLFPEIQASGLLLSAQVCNLLLPISPISKLIIINHDVIEHLPDASRLGGFNRYNSNDNDYCLIDLVLVVTIQTD